MEEIRPELALFVKAMETKLRRHDKEKGDAWKTCPEEVLHKNLEEEIDKYFQSRDRRKLTDIANYSMMIWWKDMDRSLDKCSFFSNAGPTR